MEMTDEEKGREAELREWEEEFAKFQRMLDLSEMQNKASEALARVALGKFNFFIHLTGWLSGTAYMVILGILVPRAWPYLVIPIALWTLLLWTHAIYAFWPTGPVNRFLKKVFGSRSRAERQA